MTMILKIFSKFQKFMKDSNITWSIQMKSLKNSPKSLSLITLSLLKISKQFKKFSKFWIYKLLFSFVVPGLTPSFEEFFKFHKTLTIILFLLRKIKHSKQSLKFYYLLRLKKKIIVWRNFGSMIKLSFSCIFIHIHESRYHQGECLYKLFFISEMNHR